MLKKNLIMISLKYEQGAVQNPINNLSILASENCITLQSFITTSYKTVFQKIIETKKNLP